MNKLIEQLVLYNQGVDDAPAILRILASPGGEYLSLGSMCLLLWLRGRGIGGVQVAFDLDAPLGEAVRGLAAAVPEMGELFAISEGRYLDFRPEISVGVQYEIERFVASHRLFERDFYG
ncbi:MAG TPA: hypothetical protein VFE47_25545 [Tepidisphaeraceae bacterium]|nr:hypothetical protein [Tepidisphaeraceae bacterium]